MRVRAKGISSNLKGEGFIQGGVLIFAKDGLLKYAYEEVTGEKLPAEDIMAAVEAVKKEGECIVASSSVQ